MSTSFSTPSATYDLKLDFALARKLQEWDFSSVSDTSFNVMVPQKTDFNALYYDFSLMGSIAFAIVWERQKLAQPDRVFTPVEQRAFETAFTAELDGETLDALQSALWEAFCDFFRKLATDLRRIVLVSKTAEEESAKTTQALQEMIHEEARKQVESARKTLSDVGVRSGECAVCSDGPDVT